MTTPSVVRSYPTSPPQGASNFPGDPSLSFNIDTTGLGANGAIIVFYAAGGVSATLTSASVPSPTLGGSSTGWVELVSEQKNGTGMGGCWVLQNPASNASIALVVTMTGETGGTGYRISPVVALVQDCSGFGSITAANVDNDGNGAQTTDSMTLTIAGTSIALCAWLHGSNISSTTPTAIVINNYVTDYANGCISLIQGSTASFTSGSADSNIGIMIEVLGSNTVPDTPAAPVAEPRGSAAYVAWAIPFNGGSAITDYVIQYSENGGAYSTFSDGTSTNAFVTVTGLNPYSSYTFKVKATNAIGDSSYSSASNAVVPYVIAALGHWTDNNISTWTDGGERTWG